MKYSSRVVRSIPQPPAFRGRHGYPSAEARPIPTLPGRRGLALAGLALLTALPIGGRAAVGFGYARAHQILLPGRAPMGALTQGPDGALYGVGSADGPAGPGAGVIFRLARDGSQLTDLRRFTGANGDGALPRSGVILGSDGFLYGVTSGGGDLGDASRPLGKGVVYRIRPDGTGYAVLHTFRGGAADGQNAVGPLLQGRDGVLYGTTAEGGAVGSGTVFRLNRDGSGFAVLKSFGPALSEPSGYQLWAGLIEGRDGALYGTAVSGGAQGGGTLFRLNRDGSGFRVLLHFSEQTGSSPRGRLLEGHDGALYGTAGPFGPNGFSQGTVILGGGTVYRLNRDGSGFRLLKTFGRNAEFAPESGLVQHRDGTLLGTVASDGRTAAGAVYRINPDGTGYEVIKAFNYADDGEGIQPKAELVFSSDGVFYGSAPSGYHAGGRDYFGTIFTITPQPASRLMNLSVRSLAGTGSDTLVAGFALAATAGKQVLVRGIGPRLTVFGVPGVLADPTLSLYSGSRLLASNDDWERDGNATRLAEITRQLSAFDLGTGGRDAALLPTLGAGTFSAQLEGKDAATGVAMVEIYDSEPGSGGRLVNVSARSRVATGDDILIVGFVISGTAPLRLLVRGIGPTLSVFGVNDALADPQLVLYRDGSVIRQNDNWGNASDVVAASAAAGAFALPAGSRDAALVATLDPGAYTAQVAGVNNTTGVALVEVYELDGEAVPVAASAPPAAAGEAGSS